MSTVFGGGTNAFLAQSNAAEVASLIADFGNPVTLVVGGVTAGTITAIIDDRWKAVEKEIGQGRLVENIGRYCLFYLTPGDAAKITPQTLLGYDGEQFVIFPNYRFSSRGLPSLKVDLGLSITNLYPHRVLIYRKATTVDTVTAQPQAPAFIPVGGGSAVQAFYNFTDNVDDPTEVGRIKRASFFTRDGLYLPYGTNVVNDDYVINVTTNPDGTATPLFGQIHVIQGIPRTHLPTAQIPFGYLFIDAMTDENPPAALVTIAKAMPHAGQGYWDLLAAA